LASISGLKRLLYLNTYGWIATASILICALSGIFLAIPYDVSQPYLSVTKFVIQNPFASFIRNIHYWSAQAFLVFTLLHVIDHLYHSGENRINKKNVWFRLTFSILALGYVMISGFILKADVDSQQAKHILSALMESIPVAGKTMRSVLLGNEDDFQLVYVHHIATATIILFIAIYDHVHSIWVNIKTFLIALVAIALLSWLFRAPLSHPSDPLMKGPWYFVGLQELLHWVSFPWIAISAGLFPVILLSLLISLKPRLKSLFKSFLLVLLIMYGILTITGFFFRGNNWQWQWPWQGNSRIRTAFEYKPVAGISAHPGKIPLVQGQPEGCLVCHAGMKGLSIAHSENSTGCYSCHLGDPFTLDKDQAHEKMELVPGDLSNAERTCGTSNCHPGILARLPLNMMSTLNGIVSVDRYVFGESHDPDGHDAITNIRTSAADSHLRNLCAGCHLGNPKQNPGPPSWLERGGGCNACHLEYSPDALTDLKLRGRRKTAGNSVPSTHPAINLNISNEKCKSCHSRSGRISMNYAGWHETPLTRKPAKDSSRFTLLPDGRIFEYIQADVHHQKGLSCVDCHSSIEVMGDGNSHAHKEEAVRIQCCDCHPKGKAARTMSLAEADRETQLISWLRKYDSSSGRMVSTETQAILLVNTSVNAKGVILVKSKLTGSIQESKVRSTSCNEGNAHNRLSCNSCHTAWAPQCLGCHNSYEKQTAGFDMLRNVQTKGTWVEFAGEYKAEPPALGVNTRSGKNGTIQTFVPGMILSIDKGSYKKGEATRFLRLYAPVSAHTTQLKSRSCESCHNDPLAIGYGSGVLSYSKSGKWTFIPYYEANKNDGLPEDAWIGFLKERNTKVSTREGARPFNLEEQKRILTVGSCLTCHKANSSVMKESLHDFGSVMKRLSKKCIPPGW